MDDGGILDCEFMVYGSVPTAKKRVLLRSESRLQVLHLKREKIRIEQSQQSADSYGAGVARTESREKFRSWLPRRESLRARRRVNPGVEKCCACSTFGQKLTKADAPVQYPNDHVVRS